MIFLFDTLLLLIGYGNGLFGSNFIFGKLYYCVTLSYKSFSDIGVSTTLYILGSFKSFFSSHDFLRKSKRFQKNSKHYIGVQKIPKNI